jgi:hypothetical protein
MPASDHDRPRRPRKHNHPDRTLESGFNELQDPLQDPQDPPDPSEASDPETVANANAGR